MASTPSTIGNVEQIGIGEQLATWGVSLNAVIDRLTEMAVGVTSVSLTGNKTLTTTNYVANESRWGGIRFTDGGLSSAPTVTFPAETRSWLVINTGSTYAVNCLAAGSGVSAVSVAAGKWAIIDCDGTDMFIRDLSNFGGDLALSSIADIASSRVIGNMSGSTAAPSLITVYDEDTMSSDSATGLATQQSIKAYVDTIASQGDLATVAGIASEITTVAANDANITAVAGDATDIGVVSTNIASVNTCATNIADIQDAANLFGDVVQGPSSSTDSSIPQWDGATGRLLKAGLAVGTSANNLVQLDGSGALPAVDGSSLTGLSAGGLILISEQTVSSAVAAVDITSGIDSTYDEYEIHLLGFKPATDNVSLYLRTSTDGGSTFDSGASDYAYGSSVIRNSGSPINGSSTGATAIVLDGAYNVHTGSNCDGVDGVVRVFRPSDAAYTRMIFHTSNPRTATTDEALVLGMGVRASATDVDAIRLLFSSGNIASGTVRLYGVRKS